jgi:hypothetical protein
MKRAAVNAEGAGPVDDPRDAIRKSFYVKIDHEADAEVAATQIG